MRSPAQVRPYQIVDIPRARQIVVSFLDLSSGGHYIYGLVEVDVTLARRRLASYQAQTGEHLSFTGYLIFCLAQAVDENKAVQAYRKGHKQLVVFDDVDVGIMVEHEFGAAPAAAQPGVPGSSESRAPIGHVIKRANHKTYMEIHREIRSLQTQTPQRKDMPSWMKFTLGLPGPLQKGLVALAGAAMHRDPAGMWVPMAGTVGVTSVGMFGKSSGWGLSAPNGHNLALTVGGIARKPAVVGDRVEPRELLSLTLAFNHDVVDGAPAARFTRRLIELIEGGCGLEMIGPDSPGERIHA